MRKRYYRKMVALLSVFAILFSMFPVNVVPTVKAAATDLEQDLVLWYDFEGNTDSTVTDASGNGNDGTLVNDASITTSDKGGAVTLDGDQDYVTVPTGIFDGLTDVTISSWVKVESHKDWASLYAFGNFIDGENTDYSLNYAVKAADTDNGSLELFGPYPFPSVQTGVVSSQEWVHVATVISGQTLYHYTNGTLDGSTEIGMDAGDIDVEANNFIGFHAMPHEQVEGKGLDGQISDFRIYDRALDITEVRTLADFDFTISSIDEVNITTMVGESPTLPSEVTVNYPNETKEQLAVNWDEFQESDYASAGAFRVEGTVEGTEIKAVANITVTTDKTIDTFEPISVSTVVGEEPTLPNTVNVTYKNGSSDDVTVTWDAINSDQLSRAGASFTVTGTINGTSEPVEARVYVTTEVSGELVTWYKFDQLNGTTVPDLSGTGNHATAVNGASMTNIDSKDAIDLDYNSDQHVTLPSGVASELEDYTFSTWVYLDSKTGDWARVFDFGTGSNASTTFLTPNLRLDNRGAVVTATSGAPSVGEWTHLAVTKSGEEFTIYSNGTAVAEMTDDAVLGNTTRNFIGRSNYGADPYLDAKVSDFRLYDQGLTEEEILEVIAESFSDEDAVSRAKSSLTLDDTSAVIADISLPGTAENGVNVSWTSNDASVVSDEGVVTRPGSDEEDATITLTATLSRGDYSDTKEYQVTVLADNIESVEEVEVITPAYYPPKLPEKVTVNYYDGSTGEVNVKWEKISDEVLSELGSTVQVEGTVYGTDIKAVGNVHVSELLSVEDVNVQTTAGKAPELPSTVTANYSNGMTDELAVDWNDVSMDQYAETGSFTVEGLAAKYNYTNPLIEQRADPNIYKHTDGYYYFTASVPEYNRIIMRRSKTIQGLSTAEEKVIWEAHESGEQSAHIWAPEIHVVDGNWYIHYAAGGGDGDIWKIRPYALENTSDNPMTGEWEEKGMIGKAEDDDFSFTGFSLDATIFEHNGKNYYIWAQKDGSPSNLYMAEMENGYTIKGEPMLLATPDYDWERQGFWVNEGADVIKRNGKIFVSFSASATDDNYKIGLLTADEDSDIMDPSSWYKSPEPVMESNDVTGQYGPGHSTFTVAEDGVTDILVYHARSYQEIDGDPLYDPNRHTRVKVLTWNEDGTPNFGIPNADGLVSGPTIDVTANVTVVEDTNYGVSSEFSADSLQANQQLDTNTTVTNNSDVDESIMVVMALYDGNNRMVDIQSVSKEIAAGTEATYDVGLQLPADVTDHKVKVFFWKGKSLTETDMTPVSDTFELK
ncbi:family 43 glycosylhydrolase [Aquibacillus rhizosphaerae]|uniref:family 43 glycosylhydrolase n=1 Tax=Aquibacillus rhizosphaerae TaxID=3051431 RepID=UPI002F41DF35